MEDLLIETKNIGDYRIKVYYDTYAECPCIVDALAASYLFAYNDRYIHRLHDDCDWQDVFGMYGNNQHSLDDALRELINDYIRQDDLLNYYKNGELDDCRMRYDDNDEVWHLEYLPSKGGLWEELCFMNDDDLQTENYKSELVESLSKQEMLTILKKLGKDIFIKEWESTGYSQGDYVQGIAFCTKEQYIEKVSEDTDDWKATIDSLIDGELKEISMWIWGDAKRFVLEKKVYYTKKYEDVNRDDEKCFEYEEIDSCCGYYLETQELIDVIISDYKLS